MGVSRVLFRVLFHFTSTVQFFGSNRSLNVLHLQERLINYLLLQFTSFFSDVLCQAKTTSRAILYIFTFDGRKSKKNSDFLKR